MSERGSKTSFVSEPGFCSNCGVILPLMSDIDSVKCNVCDTNYNLEAFGTMQSSYTIHFNSASNYLKEPKHEKDESLGPIVTRICPKCGNNKMSYATLQLRSADEGQTIFYTCIVCKFKENENS